MVIKVGDFVKMKNDSLAEYGINKDDKMFLVGSGFVPDSKTDPYKFRMVFVGAPIKDGHIEIGDNDKPNGYTVDGRNIKRVTKVELKILEANKEADFGGQKAQEVEAD